MGKSKIKIKAIKELQANQQSDAIEMDNWMPSSGVETTGVGTLDTDIGVQYSFGDIGDLDVETKDMFEQKLREKYPALQDAYDHYQSVKRMCETREKEEDED